MTRLVIVESHAKVKTIKKFLGRGYKVEASIGHIRDLPKSTLGVDIENDFEPKYINIRGKGDLVNKLKKEAKNADTVFLATDPDREGEAISWHLANILGIDAECPCRIEFNEITDTAVKQAIKNPRPISINMVDAQQARRVLDRIVGYQISPILWKKVKSGLSAGRVQSVAVRLICDREKEISDFVPQEYWTMTANLIGKSVSESFKATLYSFKKKRLDIESNEQVEEIKQELSNAIFVVKSVKNQIKKRTAPPPFTTSTLQQEASRKLGFTTKKTMIIAQQLYEGIETKSGSSEGLVTYIRTDSTRVSADAQFQAIKFIEENYGNQFVPSVPNQFKSKMNIQDAHECIRPTYLSKDPEILKTELKKEQYMLYRLIYERFLASQMSAAIYDVVSVDIKADEYLFKASESILKFKGYSALYNDDADVEKSVKISRLSKLNENEVLTLLELKPEQHFTEPPLRYNEASLVKMLEDMGIGRPSTYAPTISTIIERGYISREKKNLIPTELGFIVNNLILEFFSGIVDYKFTADMESALDKIEDGGISWKELLRKFYPSFAEMIAKAENNVSTLTIKDEESDIDCDKCGTKMVYKRSRYGKFLACPNFPTCRNTKSVQQELSILCPSCQANIALRSTRKGKKFYGCTRYPECNFTSWDPPSGQDCPVCGSYLVIKENKYKQKFQRCSSKECKYKTES